MQLFKRKINHKAKGPNLSKIGKDPSTDWFIVLCLFTVLVLASLSFTVLRYLSVNNFINELATATGASTVADTKTQEEKLQEIIVFYKTKEDRHYQLLGKSKSEVREDFEEISAQKRQAEIASSTEAAQKAAKAEADAKAAADKATKDAQDAEAKAKATSGTTQSKSQTQSSSQEDLELVIPSN